MGHHGNILVIVMFCSGDRCVCVTALVLSQPADSGRDKVCLSRGCSFIRRLGIRVATHTTATCDD